jgi:hypothetical protein
MAHDTFNIGDLTAVIGDNAAHGEHRAGYNGVWSLRHRRSTRSLFVPPYVGLNHEHIFNGDAEEDPAVFFEPRVAPLTFRKLADDAAELHQPPTPTFHLESWTTCKLAPPHYLDLHYRCVAHQHVFQRGYIGLFWASSIHPPDDKSMYFFRGEQDQAAQWTQLCTQRHNDQSMVLHRADRLELSFRTDGRPTLCRSLSALWFDVPPYYGQFADLIWIVMFDRKEGIRFARSPSGGGNNFERMTNNLAWDSQFVLRDYDVRNEYCFTLRAVFRPRCSRGDVMEEYRAWRELLDRRQRG